MTLIYPLFGEFHYGKGKIFSLKSYQRDCIGNDRRDPITPSPSLLNSLSLAPSHKIHFDPPLLLSFVILFRALQFTPLNRIIYIFSFGNYDFIPRPHYNFATEPEVRSRRPLWDLKHPEDPDWRYER